MSKKNAILITCAGVLALIGGWLWWRGGGGTESGETGLDPATAAIIEDRAGGTVAAEPDDPNPPPKGSGKQPK